MTLRETIQQDAERRSSREAAFRLDFRSDTVTQPTVEMLAAMVAAPLGDDVFGEDPTVNELEAEAARLLGKEAALFVSSGTQGNLLAQLSLVEPGGELIAEAGAHIANYEVGGAARLAGLTVRTATGTRGRLTADQVTALVRPENVHYAHAALLSLENTHNGAGGTVLSAEETWALAEAARTHDMRVHVDGARLFNAAVALGVPVASLAEPADTVSVCLSKGLSAPAGSLLAGSEATIYRARRFRKMVGGGMRQAGVLAACGLVALRSMIERLAEDHRRAGLLAFGLSGIEGVAIDLASVQTNIVRFDVGGLGHTTSSFADALQRSGICVTGGSGPAGVRMVAHRHIDDASIEEALDVIRRLEPAAHRTATALYG